MSDTPRPILPGDAFFLLRPTDVEAKAIRIASMPLTRMFGGTFADEFHLTVQRAQDIAPEHWAPLLGDLHRTLQRCHPFKLKTVGLWRFYSQFRQSRSLFWTMQSTPPLMRLRQILDEILEKYRATTYPFPIEEWKPHTLALHNVQGQDGDLALPDELSPPSFTVKELWLSIYMPWGSFVEHPIVIFNGAES
jgi:2'-5' RNA ligase